MVANDVEVQSLHDEIKPLKFLNLKLKLQSDGFEKDAKIARRVVPEPSAKIKKLKVLQDKNDKLKEQIKQSNGQFKDESSRRSAEVARRVQALEQEFSELKEHNQSLDEASNCKRTTSKVAGLQKGDSGKRRSWRIWRKYSCSSSIEGPSRWQKLELHF